MKKRAVTIILFFAMLLSLSTAAAAEFTDAEDVKYTEAVDVMTGIGAIDGYTDGTIKPTGTITREEAAKLIAYAILGKAAAENLQMGNTGFNDVSDDRWSAPFISYLVGEGIINGMGDGTFAPTASVTGYQFAKMMLCAAGYGAKGEFTGEGWDLAVSVAANKAGVFSGSDGVDFAAAATRQEAFLFSFNGITKVEQVSFDQEQGKYIPQGTTLGQSVFNLQMVIDTSAGTRHYEAGGKVVSPSYPLIPSESVKPESIVVSKGALTGYAGVSVYNDNENAGSLYLKLYNTDSTVKREYSSIATLNASFTVGENCTSIEMIFGKGAIVYGYDFDSELEDRADYGIYIGPGEVTEVGQRYEFLIDGEIKSCFLSEENLLTPERTRLYRLTGDSEGNAILTFADNCIAGSLEMAQDTIISLSFGVGDTWVGVYSGSTAFYDISEEDATGWGEISADGLEAGDHVTVLFKPGDGGTTPVVIAVYKHAFRK